MLQFHRVPFLQNSGKTCASCAESASGLSPLPLGGRTRRISSSLTQGEYWVVRIQQGGHGWIAPCRSERAVGWKWRTPQVRAGWAGEEDEDDAAEAGDVKTAAEETLEMLEWPRLCEAVAMFAATELGKERMRSGSISNLLTLPSNKEESETLLSETRAGYEIDGLCGGSFELQVLKTSTVKLCVERVKKGVIVTGLEAVAVAGLLQCAQQLRKSVLTAVQDNKERLAVLQPMIDLVTPLVSRPDVVKAIWTVVDEEGIVKDSASPELRKARIQERTVEQRLKELLNRISREKLGADSAQDLANIDGRLCIVVGSSNVSSVSGLVLRSDAGGYASYVEPAGAVQLNDKLAEARAEVLKAENNVLSSLTNKMRPYVDDIRFDLEVIVYFDIILARAKYSSWIGGTRPEFVQDTSIPRTDPDNLDRFDGLLQLRKARHPLLLQQHRKQLQDAKLRVKSNSRMVSRMRTRSLVAAVGLADMEAALAQAEAEVAALEAAAPVPIDVQVDSKTKVVAITGPNTGGKTAAIKTVGLAALMAKAGLYVLGAEPVYLPWFDQVLADIGDEQSLSQSLSTFSGHLKRIQRIKLEATGRSLVLLDEIGAGTDPTEGSALGMALLESFATDGLGGSLLTLATTHHGELKTLKYNNENFENASVEFDEERLRPTYRLIWGIPGRSNAINIAERLGLPAPIIQEARNLHGAASAEVNEVIMDLEKARRDYDHCIAEMEKLRVDTGRLHNELQQASERVQEQSITLQMEAKEQVAGIAAAARSALSAAARNSPRKQVKPVGIRSMTSPSPTPATSSQTKPAPATVAQVQAPLPRVGQLVQVPKLGRKVQVVKVNEAKREVTVQVGPLKMKIKATDIAAAKAK